MQAWVLEPDKHTILICTGVQRRETLLKIKVLRRDFCNEPRVQHLQLNLRKVDGNPRENQPIKLALSSDALASPGQFA